MSRIARFKDDSRDELSDGSGCGIAFLTVKSAILSYDRPAIQSNYLNFGSVSPILSCRLVSSALIPAIGSFHVWEFDQHGGFERTLPLQQLERRIGGEMCCT